MKSPLPGMDPWLEPHWPDVHGSLIYEARRHLNRILPAGLAARGHRRFAADTAEEAHPERSIRIIDESGQLITVIEFLSPTNKRQPGMNVYREKRAELLAAGVHVVEVDLVRAGDWRTLIRPEQSPPEAASLYRAVVRTSGQRPGGYLFPIPLQSSLPDVPIPLRPGEQPVMLPLQPMLESVYVDGRYDHTLDYHRELDPPLPPEDARWTDDLLRSAGRR